MSSTPFMQLYVADFLSKTLHLTTEEVGAYMLLLMAMWRANGSLPNDPQKLSRIARVSAMRWVRVWGSLSAFFDEEGSQITNPRLTKELAKTTQTSEIRKQSGSLGGKAKALKTKDTPIANATVLLKHSQISDIREVKREAIASPKKRPEVPLPPDWVPSEKNLSDAEDRQFSAQEITHEADQFRNHHLAKGSLFRDWDAAWRTWLGNARKFQSRGVMAGQAKASGYGQRSSLASIAARRRSEGSV